MRGDVDYRRGFRIGASRGAFGQGAAVALMADAFENILGQPQVREFLRATVASGRVSHAYLFCGPAGSNKTLAALRLRSGAFCARKAPRARAAATAALATPAGASCARSTRTCAMFAPEGAAGYLVEQVRGIVADTALGAHPGRSSKVYILDRVDLLGVQAANAFLKTLGGAARRRGAHPARAHPRKRAAHHRLALPGGAVPHHPGLARRRASSVQNIGREPEQARVALAGLRRLHHPCRGVPEVRTSVWRSAPGVLEVLACLRRADDWDVVGFAADLVVRGEGFRSTPCAPSRRPSSPRTPTSWRSRPSVRSRRATSASSRPRPPSRCASSPAITRSWLRDVMVQAAGAPESSRQRRRQRPAIEEAAARTDAARAAAAIAAVRRCDVAISYNVSPETCIDAMLLEVRDILYGRALPNAAPRAYAR